ncbi:MAG TPA: M48 family metallopeptidase [Thermoanaerobaculia bacterium]|nr:M48 family metallopeptidase [Thermoanaerobaculia bacterium]
MERLTRLACIQSVVLLPASWALAPPPAQAVVLSAGPLAAAGPAPAAGSTDAQAAGRASAPVAVPEPDEKATRYHRSGNVLWVVDVLWGVAVPALFLFTGFSARLRGWAQRLGRKWFFVVALYFVFWSLVSYLLDWPLAYYAGFVRQHDYGLSNQTFAKWFSDSLKGLAVGLVGGVIFLWVPYLLLAKSPRRWWLYTGLAAVPFLVFLLLVSPIWIEPLFNDFGPMKDKQLESQILALASRAGIEGSRVFEVRKSVDTKEVNAYVSGLGDTKRIVLWDTIIAKLDRSPLLFVMGHEMGHYVLGHTLQGIVFAAALILLGLYVIHRTAGGLIARWRARFGFGELADVASLPLLSLFFGVFFLLFAPLALAFSRHLEHEADRFGLELTRDNHAAATAFVALQHENLGYPRPSLLYKLWRSSHPPLGERIDFCNSYRPWEHGEPLKYGDLFRDH